MKLAINSLTLLLASTTVVIALPTPEQATPDSCIIYKSAVDGSLEKRCPIGRLETRSLEEAGCIIYTSEVDGSLEKRCPIGRLETRTPEEASCIIPRGDGDNVPVEKRCPIGDVEARSEEEAGCTWGWNEIDGSLEKRCPPSV